MSKVISLYCKYFFVCHTLAKEKIITKPKIRSVIENTISSNKNRVKNRVEFHLTKMLKKKFILEGKQNKYLINPNYKESIIKFHKYYRNEIFDTNRRLGLTIKHTIGMRFLTQIED